MLFQDGTMHNGGCCDREATPYITSRPLCNALRDYEDMNLMRAFPKQFPFGYECHSLFTINVQSMVP